MAESRLVRLDLYETLSISSGLAVHRLHPGRSILPAKNRQPPGARLTEKSQRHGELLNGSLMLPVGCTSRPPPFGPSPPRLLPSVSFTCPPSFVFLSFPPFFPLSNVSPSFRFDHLHSRVCVQQKFRGYGAFIPCLVEPSGSSRIKLDNKPRSQRDENRGR